jgi:hypothetical protein
MYHPLSLYSKDQETLNEILEDFIDIEHEFIIEAVKYLKRPEIKKLLLTDSTQAEEELYQILNDVFKVGWDKNAKAKLRELVHNIVHRTLNSNEELFIEAYNLGLLKKAPALEKSPFLGIYEQRTYAKIETQITKLNVTGVRYTIDKIRENISQVTTGDFTIDEAILDGMRDLAGRGILGHTYPSGRSISLVPYVRREISTQLMNASREVSFIRAGEWGSNLILVSSHAGARPLCFPYQGRVFQINDDGSKKYPLLESTSYGQPAGLFGINCRHTFWPYFSDFNDLYESDIQDQAESKLDVQPLQGETANESIYNATQAQRYTERQIRKYKKIANELEAEGVDSTQAKSKVKEWQGRRRGVIKEAAARGIDLRPDYLREKVE